MGELSRGKSASAELAVRVGYDRRWVIRVLRKLEGEGLVVRDPGKRGQWGLPLLPGPSPPLFEEKKIGPQVTVDQARSHRNFDKLSKSEQTDLISLLSMSWADKDLSPHQRGYLNYLWRERVEKGAPNRQPWRVAKIRG